MNGNVNKVLLVVFQTCDKNLLVEKTSYTHVSKRSVKKRKFVTSIKSILFRLCLPEILVPQGNDRRMSKGEKIDHELFMDPGWACTNTSILGTNLTDTGHQ